MAKTLTNESEARRLAFGVEEFAAAIGVSSSFARLEIARGKLKVIRAGRRVLISQAEINRYLAAGAAEASAH